MTDAKSAKMHCCIIESIESTGFDAIEFVTDSNESDLKLKVKRCLKSYNRDCNNNIYDIQGHFDAYDCISSNGVLYEEDDNFVENDWNAIANDVSDFFKVYYFVLNNPYDGFFSTEREHIDH